MNESQRRRKERKARGVTSSTAAIASTVPAPRRGAIPRLTRSSVLRRRLQSGESRIAPEELDPGHRLSSIAPRSRAFRPRPRQAMRACSEQALHTNHLRGALPLRKAGCLAEAVGYSTFDASDQLSPSTTDLLPPTCPPRHSRSAPANWQSKCLPTSVTLPRNSPFLNKSARGLFLMRKQIRRRR